MRINDQPAGDRGDVIAPSLPELRSSRQLSLRACLSQVVEALHRAGIFGKQPHQLKGAIGGSGLPDGGIERRREPKEPISGIFRQRTHISPVTELSFTPRRRIRISVSGEATILCPG